MSFQIDRGLFKFDLTDHHAVLGISVEADMKEIRKRYLKIARCLHPDSCRDKSDEEKKRANEFLSKLVNPAYEALSNERSLKEQSITLKEMSRRLAKEYSSFKPESDFAKKLLGYGGSVTAYRKALQSLGEKQYESLDKVLDRVGIASELNLVYLLRQGAKGGTVGSSGRPIARSAAATGAAKPASATANNSSAPKAAEQTTEEVEEDVTHTYIRGYCDRAETLMGKGNFEGAIKELRDALKLDPKNGRTHSLMGANYLKLNQKTMAKVHFGKALESDPNNELAQKGKKRLDQLAAKSADGKSSSKAGGKSGFLGGLFGGKKK